MLMYSSRSPGGGRSYSFLTSAGSISGVTTITGAFGASSETPFHQPIPESPRRYQGSGQRFSWLTICIGMAVPSGWARARAFGRATIGKTSVPVWAYT